MIDPAFSSSVNHLLRSNAWAGVRLAPFAGKTAQFECPPFKFALTVLDNGEVATASAEPHVIIYVTPGLLLRMAARDSTVWREIKIEGDTGFAAAINYVASNLRWDAEEDLSRIFGDIIAHRMVQTGRTLDQWRAQSFDNLIRSFAEYWTEEQPLIARSGDVAQFNRDVDALRDDVARLEKRLENLDSRQGAKNAK